MLAKHLCLPTNQLEQDCNGIRIIAVRKLIRSALRVKRGMKEFRREFNVQSCLTEDEWKSVREFEATLMETSRLTTIYQNEDKLNGACGPLMRKALHDS